MTTGGGCKSSAIAERRARRGLFRFAPPPPGRKFDSGPVVNIRPKENLCYTNLIIDHGEFLYDDLETSSLFSRFHRCTAARKAKVNKNRIRRSWIMSTTMESSQRPT